MEAISETLKTLGNSAVQVGLIAGVLGGVCGLWMLRQSTKRTKNCKATKLDALFLASSSPGFSRFSILNSPDTIGIGVYAALALEQVGAINDIKPQVDVNLKLYPDWPAVYLSAARYSALIGDKQKARDYLSVAKTLTDGQRVINDIPQLGMSVVEELIAAESHSIQSSTSIDAMHEELRKKPHQLVLARSITVLLAGLGLLLGGFLLLIARSFIA
jgi:hypothetical protein